MTNTNADFTNRAPQGAGTSLGHEHTSKRNAKPYQPRCKTGNQNSDSNFIGNRSATEDEADDGIIVRNSDIYSPERRTSEIITLVNTDESSLSPSSGEETDHTEFRYKKGVNEDRKPAPKIRKLPQVATGLNENSDERKPSVASRVGSRRAAVVFPRNTRRVAKDVKANSLRNHSEEISTAEIMSRDENASESQRSISIHVSSSPQLENPATRPVISKSFPRRRTKMLIHQKSLQSSSLGQGQSAQAEPPDAQLISGHSSALPQLKDASCSAVSKNSRLAVELVPKKDSRSLQVRNLSSLRIAYNTAELQSPPESTPLHAIASKAEAYGVPSTRPLIPLSSEKEDDKLKKVQPTRTIFQTTNIPTTTEETTSPPQEKRTKMQLNDFMKEVPIENTGYIMRMRYSPGTIEKKRTGKIDFLKDPIYKVRVNDTQDKREEYSAYCGIREGLDNWMFDV